MAAILFHWSTDRVDRKPAINLWWTHHNLYSQPNQTTPRFHQYLSGVFYWTFMLKILWFLWPSRVRESSPKPNADRSNFIDYEIRCKVMKMERWIVQGEWWRRRNDELKTNFDATFWFLGEFLPSLVLISQSFYRHIKLCLIVTLFNSPNENWTKGKAAGVGIKSLSVW